MEGDAIIAIPKLQQKALEEEQTTTTTTTTKQPEPQSTAVNPNEDLYASLPLPPHSRSIRLIDLDPTPHPQHQGDDGIPKKLTGRLRVVNLQSSPSFTALSYVWGASLPSPSPYRICISISIATAQQQEEFELDLTPNCYLALHHILHQFGPVTIWVDAICINQSPTSQEKGSQIPLMEEIYMLAESVYVWLGEGDDESDRVMAYIKQRACLLKRASTMQRWMTFTVWSVTLGTYIHRSGVEGRFVYSRVF